MRLRILTKTFNAVQKQFNFYLLEYNIAIECQGIQHYQPIEFFGGKKAYNDLIRRDKLKK